ncbi:hypothetical protein [Halorussus salinus]|uniref:hypothetical protein n=1 Tax=Halorussus salinus TaxID=1364935 RepID=UPI001092C52D|nr:hypothetical protein [Halorussus salinus]
MSTDESGSQLGGVLCQRCGQYWPPIILDFANGCPECGTDPRCDHENVRRVGRSDAVGNPVIEEQCVDCDGSLDAEGDA